MIVSFPPTAAPARDEAGAAAISEAPQTPRMTPARGGGSYLSYLRLTADRLHFAYVGHIDLECCAYDLCKIGQWLQSEADAVGRRLMIAEGRIPLW
jgi:hypothetical protein